MNDSPHITSADGASQDLTPPPAMAEVSSVLEFANDALDKKYELYNWCETKMGTLVTLDGLLLAGLFALFGSRLNSSDQIQLWAFRLAVGLMCASLFVALWHIVPKLRSGLVPVGNVRTVAGIESYSSTEAVVEAFKTLGPQDMLLLTVEQLRGMNRIITQNFRAIHWAVGLTMAGTMAFLAAVLRAL